MSDLDIIKELEKELNCTFEEVKIERIMEFENKKSAFYSIDEKGCVNGLHIEEFKIKTIPNLVAELKHLIHLAIVGCRINNISLLSNPTGFKNLSGLYLFFNQITDISPLKNLTQIKEISLASNKITDISPLKNLTQIIELTLAFNNISDISPLRNLTQIQTLNLLKNPIKILPQWITEFSKMEIKWTNVRYDGFIHFFDNPLESPPIEIVQQGKEAIKNWFEQQEKYGKEIVYEAKILIVGEPKAGKTTLLNKLQNPDTKIPDIDQSSTLGITVKQNYKFQHPTLPDVQITANIWDFGGQEIQYMLHQYFLSRDALYVVVCDGRSETSKLEYWFQMIEMFGTSSSRIVVLVNRFRDATGFNPFARVQFRRDFPTLNMVDDELDLSETDAEWQNFCALLAENIAKLPIIGQSNIRVWNKIRHKIEQIEKPYIKTNEFYQLSQNEGLMLDNEIELMLDYFNKIGVVIYYAEDPFLANTVFLNPNWITEAIYMILSHKNLDYRSGRFRRQWLFDFWQSHGYKNYECADLLNLMQKDKFDICYPLPTDNEQYMVPSILRNDMPENAFEYKDMLQLRYVYDGFMPFGIISRLIVRLYKYIHNQLVWQRGAILIYENNTKAEIVHPFGKKEIQIRINGKHRKEFRAIIKSELDMIVEQYPNKPEIEIPCICESCRTSNETTFFPFVQLIEMRETQVEKIQCTKKPYKMVNVIELINGIEFTNFRRLLLDENFEEFFRLMKSKFAGISYQTKKEKLQEGDYQREFHIILKENGLDAETEHATSDGRMDNLVRIGSNVYIFECKTKESAQEAINQIIEKDYTLKFQYDFENIYIFGVKFGNRNIEDYKFQKISYKNI